MYLYGNECLLNVGGAICQTAYGGADETRTRDLPRDRRTL